MMRRNVLATCLLAVLLISLCACAAPAAAPTPAPAAAATPAPAAPSAAPAAPTAAPATVAPTAAPTPQAAQPFTLYWWGGVPQDKGPDQVIAAYKKIKPEITIEYTKLGWDDASNVKLDTALMSGVGIDVYMPTRGYLEKAEKGLALELTPFLTKDGIDLTKDIGADIADYMYQNKYYNIPTSRSLVIWMFNMDKLKDAGLSLPDDKWTTKDMQAYAKALTKGDGANKVFGAFFTCNWANMWLQPSSGFLQGVDLYNKEFTAPVFTDPRVTFSANLFQQMQDTDKSIPSYAECAAEKYLPSQMLMTEKAAMVYSGSYVLRDIKDRATYPHTFKTGFALPPLAAEFADKAYRVADLEDPIMISPKTTHQEECWAFLKWFYREGFASFVEGGRIPSYTGFTAAQVGQYLTAGYEDLIDMDSFAKVYASTRTLAARTQKVEVSQANTRLAQQMELAMLGQQSVEQALTKAAAEAAQALTGK